MTEDGDASDGRETPTPDAPSSRLDGASPDAVRAALDDGDPLPGTAGFAGEVDGTLVRDVLGRRPVFFEAAKPARWAFDPSALADPTPLPAGHALDVREGTAMEDPDEGTATEDPRRVWTLPDPEPSDRESAVDAVREAVRWSTGAGDRSADWMNDDGLAVAFSGGVDSALVAAGVPDAPLYVAGFEGAHDVAAARAATDAMDRTLRWVEVTHDDLRRAVPAVVAATGRTNAMDVSIALPLFLVAERAAADGCDRLAVGQGADELFGGYAKVVDPASDARVEADSVRGARRETVLSLPDQLERDVLALRAAGVEPVAPFLHDRVVAAAVRLPDDALVDGDRRKVGLRAAAEGVVPKSVRTADKKAVQYGTYVSRELDRLARRAGFKRRMDDHVRKYVEALVAGEIGE